MIITAILAFVTIAGLGFVFVAGGTDPVCSKRTRQAAASSASRSEVQKRDKADREKRRRASLKPLREQEKQQRKATVSLASRLQQAGLPLTVKKFWVICVVLGVVLLGV